VVPGYETFAKEAPSLLGRKSHSWCTGRLRSRWFDPIAEVSELSDHSGSAPLPRFSVQNCPAFLVSDSLVQNLPNRTALSMGNYSDRLSDRSFATFTASRLAAEPSGPSRCRFRQ
jgi:hypothetical protein